MNGAAKLAHAFGDGREVGGHVGRGNPCSFAGGKIACHEDLTQFLDLLSRQGEVASAHLEAVVGGHWQVTGRDHHAAVDVHRPAGVIERSGGADLKVNDVGSGGLHALHQRVSQGGTRGPDVTADGQALGAEVGRERSAEALGEGRRQLAAAVAVGQTTDVVGLEAVLSPLRHVAPSPEVHLNAPLVTPSR